MIKLNVENRFFYVFFLGTVLTASILNLTSCKKEVTFSDEAIEFSLDSLIFDTVFTTVGSSTKRFKIYNKSNKPVMISKINLEGGSTSPFRVNLDGVSGTQFESVTLPGNDSLFMFVEVTLDPNNINTPLIVEDSIGFVTNGQKQHVLLAAWGQDAYFHNSEIIDESEWSNDKPHVIYNFALVDSNSNLNIQAGTRIHLHKNSLLYIRKGSLNVNGTENEKVVFEGDRLEPFYNDVKGQYYGIYFEEANSSNINHAIIKNATAGIHVFSENQNNTNYTLTIRNSEIFNCSSYGIFNYSGGRIYGENLLIHNNNLYAYFLLEGGDHNFRHCQFLGYGTDGNQPAVALKNYFTRNDGITYVGQINEGSFYNSIIHGSGENQLVFDTLTQGGTVVMNYEFNSNLIKNENNQAQQIGFVDNLWNSDPVFENIEENNFIIQLSSPLRNQGNPNFSTPTDIDGNLRDIDPDIGAYEVN